MYQNDLTHPAHPEPPGHQKQTETKEPKNPHKHKENHRDKTDDKSKSGGFLKDYPGTEDTHIQSPDTEPNSNSENSPVIHQTQQLEAKTSKPYFDRNRDTENVPKKEQKVSSEFVVEEKSEPKIGLFGFKNEKYIWPSG